MATLEQVFRHRAEVARRLSFHESMLGDEDAADGHRMRAALLNMGATAAHYGDRSRASALGAAAEGDVWALTGQGVTLGEVLRAEGENGLADLAMLDELGFFKKIGKAVKKAVKPIQKATKYVVKGNPVSKAVSKATPKWISKPLKAVARPVLATSAAVVTGGASVLLAEKFGGKKDKAYLGLKPTATGMAAGAIIGGAVLAAPIIVSGAGAAASAAGAGGSALIGAAGGAAALLPPAVGLASNLMGKPKPESPLPMLDLAPPGPVQAEVTGPTPEQIAMMQQQQSSQNTVLIVGGVALAGLAAVALMLRGPSTTTLSPRPVAGYDRPRRRKRRSRRAR